jgi:hypothetical protein
MNKLGLKPVTLLCLGLCIGTAIAALLTSALWTAYSGSASSSKRLPSASLQFPWHASHESSAQPHLSSMSEAERAALIRLQLATASGRWFP